MPIKFEQVSLKYRTWPLLRGRGELGSFSDNMHLLPLNGDYPTRS